MDTIEIDDDILELASFRNLYVKHSKLILSENANCMFESDYIAIMKRISSGMTLEDLEKDIAMAIFKKEQARLQAEKKKKEEEERKKRAMAAASSQASQMRKKAYYRAQISYGAGLIG